ncbi:MAG: tape measure protein, partial [Candidatus Cloacimonadaceae bacterium]
MAAGAVYTRLYIEGNEYFMTLKKAQAQTQEWAKDTTKNVNTVGRDFANLARSVIGITAAFQTIKKTVSEGINFNKFVAEQTAAFGVMMKSTDAAKAKIQELYTFAVESPLTFKETVSASKQLLAYGFSAESLVKNMEMLGTVAKATGHSLDDIAYVYGTLKTQNRAYSRDLMQFAMRGIPIYDELAKVMGVTTQQIKKLTEQGAVGFEQVEKAFKNMTSEGGRFTGMMDAYMKTLSGQLSMLGDIAQQSAGKLASGITSAMTGGLGGIMDALGDSGSTLTNIGTDLGMIASALINIAEAAIRLAPAIVLIVKTLIAGKILKMMT